MSIHIELFHTLLTDFLEPESALLTNDGETLAVRGENPVSFGTLATAGSMAAKYLKLQPGEIAILNDPYSGGSILSDMTFIMAVSEKLIWVRRCSLQPTVKLVNSVEEEGLRIPPTPVLQKGQLNEMILAAIQAHPACPPDFVNWLKIQLTAMTAKARRLQNAVKWTGFKLTQEVISEYLDLSRTAAVQKIGERSSGQTRVDIVLDSGELLRIDMEIHDGKITLDFGGTSTAKTVSLTESATLGVCFHTISKFYGFDNIANSGSSSVLQLIKPAGCWLVGKYPAPTSKGMTCGVAALKTALECALAQIHQKGEQALSSHCPVQFDLQHGEANLVVTLPGGRGATAHSAGASAQTRPFSIEQIERTFPVKVQRIDLRSDTVGTGKFEGGAGVLMKLEVLANMEAAWMTDLTLHRPRISKNCTHGGAGEVKLETKGETKDLPVLGKQLFNSGDIITIRSGNGGSYLK